MASILPALKSSSRWEPVQEFPGRYSAAGANVTAGGFDSSPLFRFRGTILVVCSLAVAYLATSWIFSFVRVDTHYARVATTFDDTDNCEDDDGAEGMNSTGDHASTTSSGTGLGYQYT